VDILARGKQTPTVRFCLLKSQVGQHSPAATAISLCSHHDVGGVLHFFPLRAGADWLVVVYRE